MLDTHKLMNMLESLPAAESTTKQRYTLEWERRIYRKLGNYLRSQSLTLQEVFTGYMDVSGFVTVERFTQTLRDLNASLVDKEIAMLVGAAKGSDGKINIKHFAKQFYDTYLLDAESSK
jgi:hypothetical protein